MLLLHPCRDQEPARGPSLARGSPSDGKVRERAEEEDDGRGVPVPRILPSLSCLPEGSPYSPVAGDRIFLLRSGAGEMSGICYVAADLVGTDWRWRPCNWSWWSDNCRAATLRLSGADPAKSRTGYAPFRVAACYWTVAIPVFSS